MENWQLRDKAERDEIILEKAREEKWVIDGTYRSTLKQRLQNSDLIIYLDYSSLTQVKSVLARYIRLRGKERPEIPGCEEKMSWEFLLWVFNWRKNKRNDVLESLKGLDKNKILVFKNRKKLNKWYLKEFNKKIII